MLLAENLLHLVSLTFTLLSHVGSSNTLILLRLRCQKESEPLLWERARHAGKYKHRRAVQDFYMRLLSFTDLFMVSDVLLIDQSITCQKVDFQINEGTSKTVLIVPLHHISVMMMRDYFAIIG